MLSLRKFRGAPGPLAGSPRRSGAGGPGRSDVSSALPEMRRTVELTRASICCRLSSAAAGTSGGAPDTSDWPLSVSAWGSQHNNTTRAENGIYEWAPHILRTLAHPWHTTIGRLLLLSRGRSTRRLKVHVAVPVPVPVVYVVVHAVVVVVAIQADAAKSNVGRATVVDVVVVVVVIGRRRRCGLTPRL